MTLLHQAAQKAVEAAWADLPDAIKAHPGVKALHRAALQQQPEPVAEIDRDTDGELLIDWSPGKGRMITLTLRDDGRLSYAFTWDGEQAHGQAQMPALQHQEVPREPVAWRYRYSPKQDWKLTSQPTTQWAADHSGFEEEPLYASPSTTRQQEVGSAPEGFRLLPVEATDAMMDADWDVTMSDAHSNGGVSAAAWRAMVEAAPQVTYGDGHSGVGWYMHDTDYPEEGAVFLGAAAPSTPENADGGPHG